MKVPFLKKKWLSQEQFTTRKSLLKGWINPLNPKSPSQDTILYKQDKPESPQEVRGESLDKKFL